MPSSDPGAALQLIVNGQHREWRIYLDVSHNHLYQEEKGES